MLIEIYAQTNSLNEELFNTIPPDISLNDFFPNIKNVQDELETLRLLKIYSELPDHCMQLCFLS